MNKSDIAKSRGWDEFDSDHVRYYHDCIQHALVYIERTCQKTGATGSGSGCVIGYQGNNHDGWLPIIATAGHVLDVKDVSNYSFKVQQFDWSDPSSPKAKTLEFVPTITGGRSPRAIWYTGPNKEITDIGFLRGPKSCTDGTDFLEIGTDGNPSKGIAAIESSTYWAGDGTRVAWAGFPGLIADLAKRPQPCYFEGNVSSLLIRKEFQVYIVDGHNTLGVSGGPVWAMSSITKQARVIGIISSYYSDPAEHGEISLPGFVQVTPIAPIRLYLEKNWHAKFK